MKTLFFYLALCLPWAASAQTVDATCLKPQTRRVGGVLELYLPCDFDSYQWLRNGAPIPGATQPTFRPWQKGEYSAKVTCFSPPIQIAPSAFGHNPNPSANFVIYPSPARNQLFIRLSGETPEYANLMITDLMGRTVAQTIFTAILPGTPVLEYSLAALPKGRYFITLLTPRQKLTQSLIIE